jgi:hypothetical protein
MEGFVKLILGTFLYGGDVSIKGGDGGAIA